MEQTLYDILGVTPDATDQEIKSAYRKLSKEFHPDKGGDEEVFKMIVEAYEVLSDPEARAVYDETGRVPRSKEGLDKAAIAILKQLFTNAVNEMIQDRSGRFGGYLYEFQPKDVLKTIEDAIKAKIREIKKDTTNNKEIQKKLDKIRGTILYKKHEKDNLYNQVIDEKYHTCERNLLMLEKDMEVAELVQAKAKDYVFEETSKKDTGPKRLQSQRNLLGFDLDEEDEED